jgi:hypothetical protein
MLLLLKFPHVIRMLGCWAVWFCTVWLRVWKVECSKLTNVHLAPNIIDPVATAHGLQIQY